MCGGDENIRAVCGVLGRACGRREGCRRRRRPPIFRGACRTARRRAGWEPPETDVTVDGHRGDARRAARRRCRSAAWCRVAACTRAVSARARARSTPAPVLAHSRCVCRRCCAGRGCVQLCEWKWRHPQRTRLGPASPRQVCLDGAAARHAVCERCYMSAVCHSRGWMCSCAAVPLQGCLGLCRCHHRAVPCGRSVGCASRRRHGPRVKVSPSRRGRGTAVPPSHRMRWGRGGSGPRPPPPMCSGGMTIVLAP